MRRAPRFIVILLPRQATRNAYPALAGINLAPLNDPQSPGRLSLSLEIGPAPDDADVWLRVVLLHQDRVQTSLGRPGRRRFRNTGSVFAALFAPLKILTDAGLPDERKAGAVFMADSVGEAFKGIFSSRIIRIDSGAAVQRGRVNTYTSVVRENQPTGPFAHMIVETPIAYDETGV